MRLISPITSPRAVECGSAWRRLRGTADAVERRRAAPCSAFVRSGRLKSSAARFGWRACVRNISGRSQCDAEQARQIQLAIWLGEQKDSRIQSAMMDDGIFGIA